MLLALLLSLLAHDPADPPAPLPEVGSADAREAMMDFAEVEAEAMAEYREAVGEAVIELREELEKARADALDDGLLDEANRIDFALRRLGAFGFQTPGRCECRLACCRTHDPDHPHLPRRGRFPR